MEKLKGLSKPKKAAILIVIGLLIVYFAGAYYYSSHFLKGTTINGIDCSNKTAASIEEHIKNPKVRKYFLMAIDVIVVFVLAVVCYQGIIYTASSTTSYLQNVRIPIALFYAAIPVGAAYCIIEYIYKFIYGPSYKEKMLAKEARNG